MDKFFRFKKYLGPVNSNSGFGILEVVVASGILGIMLYAMSSMMINSQFGAQSVQRRLNSVELQSFISQVLNNKDLCDAAFKGHKMPYAPPPPASPTDSVPTLTFANIKMDDQGNNLFEGGLIKIQSFKYVSVAPPTASGLYSAKMQLVVNVQGSGNQTIVGGDTLHPVDFGVIVTKDPATGFIGECSISSGGGPSGSGRVITQRWPGGAGSPSDYWIDCSPGYVTGGGAQGLDDHTYSAWPTCGAPGVCLPIDTKPRYWHCHGGKSGEIVSNHLTVCSALCSQ